MIQRLVKTTPKPSATKNSSGELVGLLDLPAPSPFPVAEGVGALVALAVDDMIIVWRRRREIERASEEVDCVALVVASLL